MLGYELFLPSIILRVKMYRQKCQQMFGCEHFLPSIIFSVKNEPAKLPLIVLCCSIFAFNIYSQIINKMYTQLSANICCSPTFILEITSSSFKSQANQGKEANCVGLATLFTSKVYYIFLRKSKVYYIKGTCYICQRFRWQGYAFHLFSCETINEAHNITVLKIIIDNTRPLFSLIITVVGLITHKKKKKKNSCPL